MWQAFLGRRWGEKSRNVSLLGADQAIDLARKCGWCFGTEAGTLLLVPSGCLLVRITGPDGAEGLRWGLQMPGDAASIKADEARISGLLKDTIESHPELEKSA